MKTKKGVKAFKKGLICKDYQFKENEIFGTDKVKVCEKGFHYCENPLDVLDYYDLCDSEFAEVEDMGVTQVEGNKSATNKIKIGAKLDLKGFIKLAFDFLFDKVKVTGNIESGNYSKVATSGHSSQVATLGHYSQVATSGDSSKVATLGHYSQVATSGHSSKVATSGHSSKVATSGHYSQVATLGHYSQVATSGHYSKVATSGHSSKVAIEGKDSVVANIGIKGQIKGVIGTWITLAEYDSDNKIILVKSAKIDGKRLKENTWYKLENNKFKAI